MRQVIIIGSGPAGYTAAIYAARANLEPLLIASSVEFGGELMKTTDVENFPGFPEGIMGPDLMTRMQQQAERFGTEIVYDDVTELELGGDVKAVTLGNGDRHEALAIIYATGSAYRKLGLEDEERLSGYGVSWCATCDGAFFRQKTVAVVGGGDSAMEEATFLTRFADKVYVIHRSETLRASPAMQDRAMKDPKIEFLFNRSVQHIYGGDLVTGVGLVDTITGEESTPTRALTSCTAPSSSRSTARSPSRAAPRGRAFPASSRLAMFSTPPTARRSPPRAAARSRHWMPSTTSRD